MDDGLPDFIENNLFSNHFLKERIHDLEGWNQEDVEEAFDKLKEIYQDNKRILKKDHGETDTQNKFIDPVLSEVLGHYFVAEKSKYYSGKKLKPDYLFLANKEQQDKFLDNKNKDHFTEAYVVADAKDWDIKLDKGGTDHRNPAFQIYNYVDRTRINWGILTNGTKWRLYSYKKCDAEVFYEIDLQRLLEMEKTEETVEKFKYFYLLFRKSAFLPEEKGFADKVLEGSIKYSKSLEDDLEDKVYNSLEVAMRGFFDTNNLEKNEENIEVAHRASLVFLYRILFVLNAESRGLLPVEDPAYQGAFGLIQLKEKIIDGEEEDINFQETTVAWDNRITRLFEGINEGYDLHESEIPAYNGGLFDHENGKANKFLDNNKLNGNYLKQVLKLLATDYDEKTEKRVIIDYKDLNIRHLGSVYEGLLEHKFKAAEDRKVLEKGEWKSVDDSKKDWDEVSEGRKVEEGELYLTNESGERKATGSYYTPEYIVEYIVENTVGPKVQEKVEEAEEGTILNNILDLTVCDPAMGSGHFLTEATKFIANRIVEEADLSQIDIEDEKEITWAKRQVVQNCIYGVDINPLAVELAKLSLWIETMAKGQPLSFLDHHLKDGNSLIGSDFEELFSHPTEDQTSLDSDRYKFGDPKEIKEEFQKTYLEIDQMPEETVDQSHEKEKRYKKFITENELYTQFKQLANIHTRQYFEEEASSSDYESFLINIGRPNDPFEDKEWFQNAQGDAEKRNYFHWQLEFPEVFFGEQKGFDAVVGNPPWGAKFDEVEKSYYKNKFREIIDRMTDSYMYFTKLGSDLSSVSGELGYITPSPLLTQSDVSQLRKYLLDKNSIKKIVNLGDEVFGEDVNTPSCIIVVSFDKEDSKISVEDISRIRPENKAKIIGMSENSVEQTLFENQHNYKFITSKLGSSKLVGKLRDKFEKLEKHIGEINRGISSDLNEAFIVSKDVKEKKNLEEEKCIPVLEGSDVRRFSIENSDSYVIYLTREDDISNYPNIKSHLSEQRDKITCSEVRKGKHPWYSLHRPRDSSIFCSPKLVGLTTCNHIEIATETQGRYLMDSLYVFQLEGGYNAVQLSILLNSGLMNYIYRYFAQEDDRILPQVKSENMYPIPVPSSERFEEFFLENIDSFSRNSSNEINSLEEISEFIGRKIRKKKSINLNIQDYLGNYSNGETLGKSCMPAEGRFDTILVETTKDRDSLKVGSVEFVEQNGQLILRVSARYKPEDKDEFDDEEFDRWGYVETEFIPAMKFDVSKKMAALIKEFVPVAVDEAGGFAGFREKATKTNSLIDRLEKLTLPKLDDVESGLEKFIENKKKAEKLEEEIQETDETIDAIVFDLYDLTEEEVETVLDSLDTPEDEKNSILEKFRGLKGD